MFRLGSGYVGNTFRVADNPPGVSTISRCQKWSGKKLPKRRGGCGTGDRVGPQSVDSGLPV